MTAGGGQNLFEFTSKTGHLPVDPKSADEGEALLAMSDQHWRVAQALQAAVVSAVMLHTATPSAPVANPGPRIYLNLTRAPDLLLTDHVSE